MFRKIHSNRDPRDTLQSQLLTEFAPYFEKLMNMITSSLKRKPKLFFGIMISLLAFSAVVSFTIMRNKEPADKKAKSVKINVVSDGFNQITGTANAIQQTIRLKRQIDSLSSKKTLSRRDSATLENDLDKLKP